MNVDRDFLIAGITPGDLNGIGYELIYKAFRNSQLLDICTPIILGILELLHIIENYLKIAMLIFFY